MSAGERLAAVRGKLGELSLDAFLVLGAENRRYLSGFTGSAGGLIITPDRAFLATDYRYLEQVQTEAPGFTVLKWKNRPGEVLAQALGPGPHRLGFEKEILTCGEFERIKAAAAEVELVPVEGLVENLRAVKDADELGAIREAAALVVSVWERVPALLREGRGEAEAALDLEFELRRAGSEEAPFQIILASGPQAALPHARPGGRRLARGDVVILDVGAVRRGYASDFTRTLVVGPAESRHRELHQIVVQARDAAVAKVAPGVKAAEVDRAAREVIAAAGYGEAFGHGLGHGVGLAVHEAPRLTAESADVLAAGMVVTIEPGLYIPGWGGVRVEDMVLVTPDGCEVLTPLPTDLVEL
ncbi:MAG: Xaa-Pro peptidase family protein [Acetobacteraceae bacterium]|nr:Xaa-Pro peptidase family protein [Acetobacteraceae bacterium]